VAALVGWALVARLPNGFSWLALLTLVHDRTGSYFQAGIAVSVASVGAGVAAPVMGRLVDRFGQTRVLVLSGLGEGLAFFGLAIVGTTAGPAWLLLVLAALSGLWTAPVAASLRALWSGTLPEGVSSDAAFSFESTAQELVFIVGPMLAAGVLALSGPSALLAVGAVLCAVGTLAFAAQRPSREWRPDAGGGRGRSALASPGVRALTALAGVTVAGFVVGEVGIVAFARDAGAPESAGVLLAILAVSSLTGGLWHGARHWTMSVDTRLLLFAVLLPLGFVPLVFAPSVTAAGFLIALGGFAIAPLLACVYSLVGRLAPEGAVTEAFSWLNAAFVAGATVAAAAAGAVVEAGGARAGLVGLVAVTALCPLVILARRRALLLPGEHVQKQ
jgi:MFS family permease